MSDNEAKDNRDADIADFRKRLEGAYGEVWDTTQLQETYTVQGFCMGCVVVERKSDGQRGSLGFTHSPRFYYSFMKG